ncbi:hypothetical protein FB446DRAFT_792318 [Lentinula raphanica]|nr:hypothetical protein FB446DRAFT_792318 [Lentinula raphanica]
MNSTNQHCNSLQALIGIFLHACNAPEAVTELFAHIGISVSVSTINAAITSLSREAFVKLRKLSSQLLSAYAYDNIDIDLKHTPTIENPLTSLIHLTSATAIPLKFVTLDDLRCATYLWERSPMNRSRTIHSPSYPKSKDDDFYNLHGDSIDEHGLLRCDRFNAWVFVRNLLQDGPEYFHSLIHSLPDPEIVDGIPLDERNPKMSQINLRIVDSACATPAENGAILEDTLSGQAGLGDPKDNPKLQDIEDHVILLFRDLGVGDRIQSLLASRSEEQTPWRRLQFLIYVLGLFHVKMACADAVWHTHIESAKSRQNADDFSLMNEKLRPRETRKIQSKPGFRTMHDIIQQIGSVTRLDIWRIEVGKLDPSFTSLEKWAESKPTLESIWTIATHLAKEYVASGDKVADMREKSDEERDAVFENMLLRQQMFLLYEEISYAMNEGDIGRVETCFMPWIWIFQATGKHRYATFMRKYLRDVYTRFPEGLKRAVRMNILVNPTGKKGKFRGVDWVVELNNLYLKRIYGGRFSNHTKQRIIKESPLIGVFKSARVLVNQIFRIGRHTTQHSGPNLKKTFRVIQDYLEENKLNENIVGRRTLHSLPNQIVQGQHLAMTTNPKPFRGERLEIVSDGDLDAHEWIDLLEDAELSEGDFSD